MFNTFINRVSQLYKSKDPFAIAFVINRQNPSSGKPGDKAVIERDGKITGWVGGGCTRGIVLKEALDAINNGKPRVVNISPEGPVLSKPGVMDYKMTCHSGGQIEVYIDPILPRPHILILGKSHVALALSKIALAMDYQVSVLAHSVDNLAFPGVQNIATNDDDYKMIQSNSFIVICTQGDNDEAALEYALKSKVEYISFIASHKKANAVFYNLRKTGSTFEDLKKIKTPAGLDINAKLPEEVAVSILAEIISHLRNKTQEDKKSSTANMDNPNLYINPVCGIPVEKSTAKHVIEYKEEKYYFCCDGCKVNFEKEPEKYVTIN